MNDSVNGLVPGYLADRYSDPSPPAHESLPLLANPYHLDSSSHWYINDKSFQKVFIDMMHLVKTLIGSTEPARLTLKEQLPTLYIT